MRIGLSFCPRSQYTVLITMGRIGSCGPMKIIFNSVIKRLYISLSIKFMDKLKNTGNNSDFLQFLTGDSS